MQHTHHRSRTKRTKEAKEEEKEEEGEEEKEEEEEETAHINSNNPHLTGGEKPRENGENSADCVGPRGSRLFCSVFWRCLPLLVKNKKNFEKTKKNSTDYVGPRGSHRAIVSRVLFFFVLLLFSRSFWSFWCPLLFCGGGFVVWRCS